MTGIFDFYAERMNYMNSVADIWSTVLDMLSAKLTPVAISTWFGDCKCVDMSDSSFVLYTPARFKKNIIESRFTPVIKESLREIFAADFDVIILDEDGMRSYKSPQKTAENEFPDSEEYTFENFVVGSSNKFAHAAAMAVAEGQTNSYNPLFIHGPSGLGKTHLLYAIRHVVKKLHPNYNIVYVKGDDFTNDLITAIQAGKNVEFREKYRNANLFLMDDVQFIAGRTATQEEFFHTFNSLYQLNRQIVFTSDRPPNEIMRLTDRLKTRFESGLIADIQPPDYETRVAIINNKAIQLGIFLPEDIVNYIAENMTSNVRQIEGAVKKVKAYKDIMDEPITVTTVSKIIKDMFREKTEYLPTPDNIIDETAKFYSLSSADLKGRSQTKKIVLPRQISMYLIRTITNLPLIDIGEIFGRDHTTVMSSISKIEDMLPKSTELAQIIKDITANINSKN